MVAKTIRWMAAQDVQVSRWRFEMILNTQRRLVASSVFSKSERRRFVGAFLAAALLILAASLTAKGGELSPDTLKAWDTYVQKQNARVAGYSKATPFLWSDQSRDRLRDLHKGKTVVASFGVTPHRVPHGLIHHWIGAVFLPRARLDDVISIVRDYGRYEDIYSPNVVASRVVRKAATGDTFSLRLLNKAVVATFALDAEFRSTFGRIDENKWYSISYTTRVREVENYGLADEHEAPANTGRGLIWRLYSISRFEQRDRGVYVELEVVALSRDVPGAIRWLVNPIVRRTSRSSISVSLQKTEEAVAEPTLAAKGDKKDAAPVKSDFSTNLPVPRVQKRVDALMPASRVNDRP
jgi:hypothetical protein